MVIENSALGIVNGSQAGLEALGRVISHANKVGNIDAYRGVEWRVRGGTEVRQGENVFWSEPVGEGGTFLRVRGARKNA